MMPSCWNISLPDSWSCGAISSVCVKTKMRDPSKNPDDEFLYVDVSSVSNESFTITSSTPTQGAEAPSRARKAIETDDVLYATVRPYLKRVAKVPSDLNGQIASTGYCVIRADKRKASPDYLYYLLLTEQVNTRIRDLQKGSSYPAVSDKEVVGQLVPLPTLPEQRSIATVLAKIQEAIATQQEIIDRARELKKSLMVKLFTKGLRGEQTKESEVGPVPESWAIVKLIDAVQYIDYGYSISIPASLDPDGYRIVSTADITKHGRMLYDQIRKISAPDRTVERLTLNDGDVLFNWRNSPELVGKTAVFSEQGEPHIFASFILRIKCDEVRTHNHFLSYLLNYMRETGVFLTLARRAVNQANFNKNELSEIPIALPGYAEQKFIADVLRKVDEKEDCAIARQAQYTDLFKAMLHELMTGSIRTTSLMEA